MRRGEFEETAARVLGCPRKRRQPAKPDADRGIGSCLGHPYSDQPRTPRDFHFIETETGTEQGF